MGSILTHDRSGDQHALDSSISAGETRIVREDQCLRDVEQVRPVAVRCHIMSLSVLNEGREVPEKHGAAMVEAGPRYASPPRPSTAPTRCGDATPRRPATSTTTRRARAGT